MTEDAFPRAIQEYGSILDLMLEGCQILDRDWRYLYLNDAIEKHSRRPNSELIGKRFGEAWPGVEQTELFRRMRVCMEKRVHDSMVNEFSYPDGEPGWFDLRFIPVPEGLFILSIEVSEQILAERELRLRDRELFEARKLEAIGRLAGGIAHDFNNMIGVILGHSELALMDCPEDSPMQADLRAIQQAAERSAGLV